jgi:hypothetical protein
MAMKLFDLCSMSSSPVSDSEFELSGTTELPGDVLRDLELSSADFDFEPSGMIISSSRNDGSMWVMAMFTSKLASRIRKQNG